FIHSKIRPDVQITINRIDEDLPLILHELRYPGYITKNHLSAIGAPNIWPNILALLAWMVELANYLHFDREKELEDRDNEIFSSENDQFEVIYQEYLNEGFKQLNAKSDF